MATGKLEKIPIKIIQKKRHEMEILRKSLLCGRTEDNP